MSDRSNIAWTNTSWVIVEGCDYVSPGCARCYAAPMVYRLSRAPNPRTALPLAGLTEKRGGVARWTGEVACREDRLDEPRHWRDSKMVFVPNRGDLFHEAVPWEFIDRVFGVMADCPRHTFQVLTKRPERLAEFLARHRGD
jgi:protein gp37